MKGDVESTASAMVTPLMQHVLAQQGQLQQAQALGLLPGATLQSPAGLTQPPMPLALLSGAQGESSQHSTRKCKHKDCQKTPQGNSAHCKTHGGGRRCKHEGCSKCAQGSTPFCVGHGGGRRCQFEAGCTKSAQGKTPYCVAHGGGKRCRAEKCTKSAVGRTNLCIAHAGGKRCQMDGCDKSAQGKTSFCTGHGGGRRCSQPECRRLASGSSDLCKSHKMAKKVAEETAVAAEQEATFAQDQAGKGSSAQVQNASAPLPLGQPHKVEATAARKAIASEPAVQFAGLVSSSLPLAAGWNPALLNQLGVAASLNPALLNQLGVGSADHAAAEQSRLGLEAASSLGPLRNIFGQAVTYPSEELKDPSANMFGQLGSQLVLGQLGMLGQLGAGGLGLGLGTGLEQQARAGSALSLLDQPKLASPHSLLSHGASCTPLGGALANLQGQDWASLANAGAGHLALHDQARLEAKVQQLIQEHLASIAGPTPGIA